MEAIAAGRGRKPKPFMLNGGKVQADAVWDSRTGLAAQERNARAREKKNSTKITAGDLPDFIAPQLCDSLDRPPSSTGWIHEIKFDGYRIQMRVLDGNVTLKTRKGLDWTTKYPAIAQTADKLPDDPESPSHFTIGTKITVARSAERQRIRESQMRVSVLALAAATILAACTIAAADDNGALTGAAGGAVTGAVVGGPVGAVVGGAAGAVVGGAATGAPPAVVVEPAQPCATRTTTKTNNNTGSSRTTQTTDCPD
jgi:hypothetical protein